MQRRGFLAAILGGVGALLAGKLPARAQETELVKEEMDRGLPRLDRVCSGSDGELLYLFPDGAWREATEEEVLEAATAYSEIYRGPPLGFTIIDDSNPITKDGRIIHLSGMGTADIPEGRYWGEIGEDIVSAVAQQIDAEIMGDAPQSCTCTDTCWVCAKRIRGPSTRFCEGECP